MIYRFLPLTWQSHGIAFADWVTLATLCLAPLVAHVLGGVPKITNLTKSATNPRWHDTMCLFNPTSILWRYWAIMDRRARTHGWDAVDMACANTLFWTDRGFDGSEERCRASRPLCTEAPPHSRLRILSAASATTLVITLQAAGFMFSILNNLINGGSWSNELAVDYIFSPLAFLGLLRLGAALWVSDDFRFSVDMVNADDSDTSSMGSRMQPMTTEYDPLSMRLLQPSSASRQPPTSTFKPINKWYSRVLRFLYIIPIAALWTTPILFVMPSPGYDSQVLTVTDMVLVVFYLFFLGASILILAFFFIFRERRCITTVLPCIGQIWYKMYTIVLGLTMLIMIVVAAIETHQVPCGRWTTLTDKFDIAVCNVCPADFINAFNFSC